MRRFIAAAGLAALLAGPAKAQEVGFTAGVQHSEFLGTQPVVGVGVRLGSWDVDAQAAFRGETERTGTSGLPVTVGEQQVGTLYVPARYEYGTWALQAQVARRFGPLSIGPLGGFGTMEYRAYWVREPRDVRIGSRDHPLRYWGGVVGWEEGPLQVRFTVARPNIETREDPTIYGISVSLGR